MKPLFTLLLFLIFLTSFSQNFLDDRVEKAIQDKDINTLEKLIKEGVDINRPNLNDLTPLALAITYQNLPMINLFLDNGADVNFVNRHGTSILIMALGTSKVEFLERILKEKVDVNYVGISNMNILFFAVSYLATSDSYLACFKRLLKEKKLDINTNIPTLGTALHFTVITNNTRGINALLEAKANTELLNASGQTPLTFAIQLQKPEIVALFVKHNLGLKDKNKDGQTPLELAEQMGNTDIIDILKNGKFTPIKERQTLSLKDMTQLLSKGEKTVIENLSKFENINEKNENGETLLMSAVQSLYLDLTKEILKKGANINDISNYQGTALHIACSYEQENADLIHLLCKNGADVNLKDSNGNSPLHLAARAGSFEKCKTLLYYKCPINAKNNDEKTAMNIAKDHNHLFIQYYLKNPTDFKESILWKINNILLKPNSSTVILEKIQKSTILFSELSKLSATELIDLKNDFIYLGDYKKAKITIEKLSSSKLKNLHLAEILLYLGDFSKASNLINQLTLNDFPKNESYFYYVKASYLFQKNKFPDAISSANKSIAINDNKLRSFKCSQIISYSYLTLNNFIEANANCIKSTSYMSLDKKLIGDYYQNQAVIWFENGYILQSEKFLEISLAIYHHHLPLNHPDYLKALTMYANTLIWKNEYAGAEVIYNTILKKYEEIEEKNSIHCLEILHKKASLYEQLGNFQEAIVLLKQNHKIALKNNLIEHSFYIENTIKLAKFYRNTNNFEQSLNYTNDVMKLTEKLYGKHNKYYIDALHNLGLINIFQKKYIEAEENLLSIRKYSNNKYSLVGESELMLHLGVLFQVQKQYQKAENAYFLSINHASSITYQKEHQLKALSNISKIYIETKRYNEAQKRLLEIEKIESERIEKTFPILSENEKQIFYEQIKKELNLLNVLLVYHNENNDTLKSLIYNHQLNYKALLLHQSIKIKNQILSSNNEELIEKYEKWQKQKNILLKQKTGQNSSKEEQEIFDNLNKNTQLLEKELSLASSEFKKQETKKVDWKNIQKKLEENEVAIEMIRCAYEDSIFYYALMITPTSRNPDFILLSKGDKLETDDFKYLQNCIQYQINDERSYQRYFKKIHKKIPSNTKTIYFSPDGIYNKININTFLIPSSKKYLIDLFEIQLLTNTKELVEGKIEETNNDPIFFGRPTYDGVPSKENETRSITYSNNNIRNIFEEPSFSDLPGTEKEITIITNLLSQHQQTFVSYLKEDATESTLKKIKNPSILHLATHGFFFSNNKNDYSENNTRSFNTLHDLLKDLSLQTNHSNPMTRSGIILTGASTYLQNDSITYQEDGIFTAYEALSLKLDKTQLVVLSACETGLGDVVNGEGVYGLQRALKIAGTESILMSLWKVDDDATQKLMALFYENWLKTKNKREAFTLAQQELKKEYPEPYFWGAFILIGK